MNEYETQELARDIKDLSIKLGETLDLNSQISVITGKIVALNLYAQNKNDKFMIDILDSILKDLKYKDSITINNNHNKYSLRATSEPQEEQLDVKEVQIPQPKIKQPLKPVLNIVGDNIEYEFKYSSNLLCMNYNGTVLKITFKGNNRSYTYPSVPKYHIDKMILLDENGGSAGKYFNSEVKKNYAYTEVTGSEERVG